MYDERYHAEKKALLETGYSKTAVACHLNVNRTTVSHWIKDESKTKTRKRRRHKLDPYKAMIRERLDTDRIRSAKRLFDEVRADGYDGCYSHFAAFVKTLRKSDVES